MCLILFAFQSHPGYKLILAANRDEFYHRPTVPAAWWKEPPFIKTPEYGTRSSTVLLVDNNNHVTFAERNFVPPAENHYRFKLI